MFKVKKKLSEEIVGMAVCKNWELKNCGGIEERSDVGNIKDGFAKK